HRQGPAYPDRLAAQDRSATRHPRPADLRAAVRLRVYCLCRLWRLAAGPVGLDPALDGASRPDVRSLSDRACRLRPVAGRGRRGDLEARPAGRWPAGDPPMMSAVVILLLVFLLAVETPIAFAVGVAAFGGLLIS